MIYHAHMQSKKNSAKNRLVFNCVITNDFMPVIFICCCCCCSTSRFVVLISSNICICARYRNYCFIYLLMYERFIRITPMLGAMIYDTLLCLPLFASFCFNMCVEMCVMRIVCYNVFNLNEIRNARTIITYRAEWKASSLFPFFVQLLQHFDF